MERKKCPHCTSRNGRAKNIYDSLEDAQECADYLLRSRGKELRSYACEYGFGYHLSSDIHRRGQWG